MTSKSGRGAQCNAGAAEAKGDILFFVHADMIIPHNALKSIEHCVYKNNSDGGGFSNVFDRHNEKIKRIGRWMNFRWFKKK